jgi:hypothetical protein
MIRELAPAGGPAATPSHRATRQNLPRIFRQFLSRTCLYPGARSVGQGEGGRALIYVGLSNGIGILAAFFGAFLARSI